MDADAWKAKVMEMKNAPVFPSPEVLSIIRWIMAILNATIERESKELVIGKYWKLLRAIKYNTCMIRAAARLFGAQLLKWSFPVAKYML